MRRLIFLGSFLLLACTSKHENSASVQNLTGDFVIQALNTTDARLLTRPTIRDEGCADHIKRVTCWSDSEVSGFDPNCDFDKVPPELLSSVQEAAASFPPLQQQVICHVNRLQIQPNIFSIAYAGGITDENHKKIGNMIGVRADALSDAPSRYDIWTWKEQLNFGLTKMNDPNYVISPLGPVMREWVDGSKLPMLLTTMIHEIGHLIDFMNQADVTECHPGNDANTLVCGAPSQSFNFISWSGEYTRPATGHPHGGIPDVWKQRYPWLLQFCYYYCAPGQTISPSHIPDVYAELRGTSFMTSYSSSDAMEDFAEASMIWSLKNIGQQVHYTIHGPQGETLFDLDQQWDQPILAAKRKWLADFFARPGLVYEIQPPTP